jgi:uncharacterized protein
MKKWLFCVLLFLGFSTGILAQNAKSLLWKVSNSTGEREGYLYGTIHVPDPRVTSWDETFYSAFSECNLLLGELDMKVLTDSDVNVMGALFMEDTLLHELYTPEEWSVLNDSLRMYFPDSFSFAFMEMMYPLMIESSVSQMRVSKASLSDIPLSDANINYGDIGLVPDVRLQDMARENGYEVRGIESVDDQLALFRLGGAKEQAKALYRTIVGYDGQTEKKEEWDESTLVEKYVVQDIDFFQSIINVNTMGSSMYHYFFEKRNLLMLETFVEAFDYAIPFCAVGAGHLAGKGGIIELLREDGFLVEPVAFRFLE